MGKQCMSAHSSCDSASGTQPVERREVALALVGQVTAG